MSDLRALVTYVERRGNGKLDWQAFLHALADEFHGKTGLGLHLYGVEQGGHFIESADIEPVWLNKYREYAKHNPWLRIGWTKPEGTLIVGEQVLPFDHTLTNFREFFLNFMAPQNLLRGLGAILLKHRDVNPDWCIAIGIFRPDGERGVGVYAEEEVERFRELIPFMMRHVKTHPAVLALRLRRRRRNPTPPEPHDISADLRRFLAEVGIDNAAHQDLVARVIDLAQEQNEQRLSAIEAALGAAATPAVALPESAPIDPRTGKPQYYFDRPRDKQTNKRENIAQFLERVWYDPWIKAGVLTRVDLTRLDGQAAQALQHYMRQHELPAHLKSILRKKAPPK